MEENQEIIQTAKKGFIGYIIAVGTILLCLGIILSVFTKNYIKTKSSGIAETRKLNELLLILNETKNKKDQLEKQVTNLRQQIQDIDKNSMPAGLTNNQFQKLYQIAGLTPVVGSGIIIKIKDADNSSQNAYNTEGIVQSEDILKIINELKAAGASVISINDQRLVTTSEIITVGNNIMVNQNRLSAPYTIKVIGFANSLIPVLKMRGGIIENLQFFGIKINIEKSDKLKIPAYTGSLS